jgi:predicted nucleotidyltransferase component of viral defense system
MDESARAFHGIVAARDLLREHILHTSRRSGFRGELVEKDFYCSSILAYLAPAFRKVVAFKGGTCLSKVHARFYRLSEDLDFAVSVAAGASRGRRRTSAEPVKAALEGLSEGLPWMEVVAPFAGLNESRQYIGTWGYRSVISGEVERVKIEVSFREPLLLPPEEFPASCLLLSAITGQNLVAPCPLSVMPKMELWAEKVRAALTRREAAIRDFFDLDYARTNLSLDLEDGGLREMVARKLAVPGNDAVDITESRRRSLEEQVEGQLRPVLREPDFAAFDLERIWGALSVFARSLGP